MGSKARAENPIVLNTCNESLNKCRTLKPMLPHRDDHLVVASRGAAGIASLVDLLDKNGLDGPDAASSVVVAQTVG